MLLVCAFTFIPIKEWNEVPINDFVVIQEMDTTSIVLLTDQEHPSLMLVSMPGTYYLIYTFFINYCVRICFIFIFHFYILYFLW